jgi:hypothetical protein
MEAFAKKDMEHILAEAERIFQKYGVTEKEKDTIWQAMAAFCAYQLQENKGPFAQAAKKVRRRL